jgi:hypothetical protein
MEKTSLDAEAFVENWVWLWSRVTCLPNFKADMEGRVMLDLLNEPDSMWQGWQPQQGKAGKQVECMLCMACLWGFSKGLCKVVPLL